MGRRTAVSRDGFQTDRRPDRGHVRSSPTYSTASSTAGASAHTVSQGGRTLVSELCYGSASRGLRLGQEVEESASSAKFENGVLTLLLPKKREASSRTLKIQSSASAV